MIKIQGCVVHLSTFTTTNNMCVDLNLAMKGQVIHTQDSKTYKTKQPNLPFTAQLQTACQVKCRCPQDLRNGPCLVTTSPSYLSGWCIRLANCVISPVLLNQRPEALWQMTKNTLSKSRFKQQDVRNPSVTNSVTWTNDPDARLNSIHVCSVESIM